MTQRLPYRSELIEAAQSVRVLFLDVDGVLTNGKMYLAPDGGVAKAFDIRDGHILALMRRVLHFPIALLSGRDDRVTTLRAEDLGIDRVAQGVRAKVPVASRIASELGLTLSEAAYVGDDINDVPLLRAVRLAAAPADATAEARESAMLVCGAPGGAGAVRELCELILKAQGTWQSLIERMG